MKIKFGAMKAQILNLEEHTTRQLGDCISSVYDLFQSIRYGRVKEGEILSALIYGGAFPHSMVAKIENTLIHYAVMDQVYMWTKRGLLDGQAQWHSAHNGSKEELVGWSIGGQNFKFSRVNGFDELPRFAQNRKISGLSNHDQLCLFDWNAPEGEFPPEVQILHAKEFNPQKKEASVRVWAIALRSSGLWATKQVLYFNKLGRESMGPVEQGLGDFSIKETGIFDRALKRAQDEISSAG